MKKGITITNDTYWVGVNDKETHLFESLWPLPEGVSYNAYLIDDEKTALIDTVKITYQDNYLDKVRRILGTRKLDYLVINHMEPDHSGSIKAVREAFPEVTIVGNKRTMNFLEGFYNLNENTKIVKDGDTINLGKHQLKFYITPMVHWPETMMTYDEKDKILYSGDAFGGFGALAGGIFDDEVNIAFYEDEIRRYFTNIVAKYSPMVQKAINKLNDVDINVIASTHGPVWRDDPAYIIDKYNKWSKYETEEGAVVVYGSMYGNTKVMAEAVARGLAEAGIEKVRLYDASRTHVSYLYSDIWNYRGLILGSCTYNTELFPPVATLVRGLMNRGLKNHILGIFGSYSWSGGAVKELKEFSKKSGLTTIDPVVETRFAPGEESINQCKLLGKNMAKAVKG